MKVISGDWDKEKKGEEKRVRFFFLSPRIQALLMTRCDLSQHDDI